MRRPAAACHEHLVPIQLEKLFVLPRAPGKRVDTIKTENVVDAEKMKAMGDRADSFPPPIETAILHCRPAIHGDPPVLSPFLSEPVVFEMRFRGCAAAPIERELLRPGEHVRTVIADTKRNVAHQRDAF